ncbi:hypothetical protein [Paraburkholderia sp. MM5482-R1]|uniref:hypothetical protein n=1 Tax=unclassified Paraburkholderia TaxID=2615204 RepID=UPI003D19854B
MMSSPFVLEFEYAGVSAGSVPGSKMSIYSSNRTTATPMVRVSGFSHIDAIADSELAPVIGAT